MPLAKETINKKIDADFYDLKSEVDLILTGVWLAASIAAIYLPVLTESPVRVLFTLPVIFFIPGYSLIAFLFPKKGDISFLERMLLSIGFSIVVVPLIGLGLNFTPGGIRLESILIVLIAFTLLMLVATYFRRVSLPSEERYRTPFFAIIRRIRLEVLPRGERGFDRFLSIILILVIIVVITTTIYVIASPKENEHFSEFYILGENMTAANYPNQIIPGQNYSMFVGVGNYEYRDIDYTIETWMLVTEFDNITNSSRITEMDPGDRLSFTLSHNETTIIPYNLSVRKSGYNRIEFLLFNESGYNSELSGSGRINMSYRDLHLMVNVQEAE